MDGGSCTYTGSSISAVMSAPKVSSVNRSLLCGKSDEEVDGFEVDCGREHVAEAVRPFLVFKLYQVTFVFYGAVHVWCNNLVFVAGGWLDGHVLEGDFVETAEVPKHVEFVANCISSMGRSC